MAEKQFHILNTKQQTHTPESILLVTDAADLLEQASCHLLSEKYELVAVSDLDDAVRSYMLNRPSVVVIDFGFTGSNGFVICKQLHELANNEYLPIIGLIEAEDSTSFESSFKAGICDVISKPVDWKTFKYRLQIDLKNRGAYLQLLQNNRILLYAQRLAKLGYWEMDLDSMSLEVSDEAARIMNVEPNSKTLAELLASVEVNDLAGVQSQIDKVIENHSSYNVEHKLTLFNKQIKIISHQGAVVERRPGCYSLIVAVQDITARVETEELIRFKTFHDSLCGLPNKLAFSEKLDIAMQLCMEEEKQLAVFFVGLDKFKKINNSFGHRSGDMLLLAVAARMNSLAKEGVVISRYDGDVFSVLKTGFDTVEEIEAYANQIKKVFDEPFTLKGSSIYLTASMGISIYPLDGDTRDELIKKADTAMHEARGYGGGQYRYHTQEMQERAHRNLLLEQELRSAIREVQLQVYFQPQIDVGNNTIAGAEALLRWKHHQYGFISPDEFIPLAEDVGLIHPIGMYVMESCCEILNRWNEMGLGGLRLGINLSAAQFRDNDLVLCIQSMLEIMRIAPQQVELEITERMAMTNFDKSISMLQQLRELGIKTSMDDFGTGYSSLSQLQDLPLDTLKIDRAFIKNIDDNGKHGEIAKAILAMAQSLGLHTIAEGVETESQYRFLKEYGVDEIQGWYFGRPMPAEEFEQYIKAYGH